MTTLVLVAGDDEDREYEYNDALVGDIDLTGCTVSSVIDYYNGSMAPSAVIWGPPANGLIRIKVTAAQTTELRSKFERGAHYSVRVVGPSTQGLLKTIVQGRVAFREE